MGQLAVARFAMMTDVHSTEVEAQALKAKQARERLDAFDKAGNRGS